MYFATSTEPTTATPAPTSTAMPSASVNAVFAASASPPPTSAGNLAAIWDAAPTESLAALAASCGGRQNQPGRHVPPLFPLPPRGPRRRMASAPNPCRKVHPPATTQTPSTATTSTTLQPPPTHHQTTKINSSSIFSPTTSQPNGVKTHTIGSKYRRYASRDAVVW